MKAITTAISGVLLVEPQVFKDDRGWFTESYSQKKLAALGITNEFVQDNHSFSALAGTVRGLHFQKAPHTQSKLVRCTRGAVRDVAVDIRAGSPTYLEYVSAELTPANALQLLVPRGFAHGFVTLLDDTEVQYKVDSYYCKESDRSIRFDDLEIGIDWQWKGRFSLSEKDAKAPSLKDSDHGFRFEG